MTTFNYRLLGCVLAAALAGCGGDDKPAPTVTSVAPTLMCVDGGALTITGTGFQDGTVIRLDDPPTMGTSIPTTFGSATSLTSTIPGGQTAGVYDVVVVNPDGQSATLVDGLTIVDKPLVFFVDPPTIWNGLSVQVTIYVSGINGDVLKVEIAPHGSTNRQELSGFVRDPDHPNRIQVTLPAGLAAGAYDVFVTDEVCEGVLENGFTVTGETNLTLFSIDPAFGWTGADTAVTVAATGGLTETPRVYLNPQGGGLAAAARAVVFVDATTLTAVVPEGLPPGLYDVIVINPDGAVGVLTGADAFDVTPDPPPTILDASPGSIDSGTVTAVTLSGSGFHADSTVTLFCVDATGLPLADQMITPMTVSAAGDSLTFSSPALDAGTVCVLRVTNPDGTFGDFSAITVTNPASNLEPFQTSTTAPEAIKALGTPRRALAVLAGRVTNTQRYLFAIGGDDGTVGGALATVESTPIDLFGKMIGWQLQAQGTQPRLLDRKRTFAGAARVGQYLYVAGGHDGASVLDTIVRARILDPLQVPELDDLDFRTDAVPGLAPGNWVYRVSAVVPDDGETLPSEPINVTIPDLTAINKTVQVTVTWTAIPGATGYKVYRTRTANDAAATVAFLADATMTSFTDTGEAAPAGDALPPLAVGALGIWHVVGTMSTPRMGAAVTAASGATANDWFLYVGGGSTGDAVLSTYEYLPITIDPATESQTVGTLTVGARTIGTARWRSSAWTVDASVAAGAGDDSWVYFGTGENAAGTNTVSVTAAGQVNAVAGAEPAGELLAASAATLEILGPSSVHSGTGAVAASGFLYDFGGGPTPATGGFSAEVCRPGLAGCATTSPPEVANWNSLGAGGVLVPRYLTSAAIESAFIFVAGGIGGVTGTEVLTSVERTIR